MTDTTNTDEAVSPDSLDEVRAQLSDARRAILHRQERAAMATLATIEGPGSELDGLLPLNDALLRIDLLELSVLKHAREIAALRERLVAQSGRAEAPPDGPHDPRSNASLNARVEALELWILRSLPAPT